MERVKAIFDYVLELQPEQREVFLKKISTQDPEAHEQVRRMLDQAQADTEDLPSKPAESPIPGHNYIFEPCDLIGERYLVVRVIAKGGMGEVYEVEDRELHSWVALKVISLKSAARANAGEMFRREITLARQVTHPNVCRIYDLGHHDHPEHGDLLFLTMELLHGATLSEYVRTSGTLTKEEALPLLEQMIPALSAAHKLNIAHRDFKSGNVILCGMAGASADAAAVTASGNAGRGARASSGPSASSSSDSAAKPTPARITAESQPDEKRAAASPSKVGLKSVVVKVTDFGLARSLDGMETTVHNEIWGTPDYMAPEQFHGHSSTASDIYALGVVIYEMFTGKLPHRSSTSPVQPDGKPSATLEKIPAEWRPVVCKCMAYEPADRYATVEDVWAALNGERAEKSKGVFALGNRALAAITVFMIAVLGLTGWLERERIYRLFHPLPGPKHIAVLPFESIGGDADAKAFADGMGETLTSKLTQLQRYQKAFWVVPFSDSRKRRDVEDAYRRLNVNLVITGSTQRSKDSVKVTANLIDAKTHQQLGSRIMTASVGDLDVLQDRVWQSVAEMVDLQMSPEMKRSLAQDNTAQPDAYDYYQQGLGYRLRYELSGVEHAIELFQKAISKDPKYALAYAAMGEAYWAKYALTHDSQWLDVAVSTLNKALQIDENLAIAHYGMGEVHMDRGELDQALVEFRQALTLEPTMVRANYRVADIYRMQGKIKEAVDEYKSALSRRPGDWSLYAGLGIISSEHGDFEGAAKQFQTMIDLQPDNPLGYQNLGAVYMEMGRYDDAIAIMKKGASYKESSALLSNLAAAYIFEGKYAEAVPYIERAAQLAPHKQDLWRTLGDCYRQVPSLSAKAPEAYRKALAAAQEELAVSPHSVVGLRGAALYYAHLGDAREAEANVTKALQLAPNNGEVLFTSALVYEIIGHRKQALEAIDKATRAGYSLAIIEHDPELAALRKDPQYQMWLQHQQSVPKV